jgi:hypothetical protein
MIALLVVPGEREPSGEREGRGTRWMDHIQSFHLGSLPLALLAQCSAGNDRMAL